MKTFQIFMWVVLAAVAFAEGQPFERYQTIIDRKPFGPEPVNFDPEAAPGSATPASAAAEGGMTAEQRTAEEQQLAASVRVSILNVAPSGAVKVGFTDSSANPVENYYLPVGGSQNGWTVKSADPSTESVTLEKSGVEVTIKLGETAGGKGGAGAPSRASLRAGTQPVGGLRAASAPPPGLADGAESPRPRLGGLARLRQRRMEIAAQEREDAARKREADAVAQAEQQAREQRETEEKQRAAEERAQQREALLQIQEQLRKQREEREAARREQQEAQDAANDTE